MKIEGDNSLTTSNALSNDPSCHEFRVNLFFLKKFTTERIRNDKWSQALTALWLHTNWQHRTVKDVVENVIKVETVVAEGVGTVYR